MDNSRFIYTGRLLAALLLVLLALAACGGDLAGEPQVVSTVPPRATVPPTADVPFSLDAPEVESDAAGDDSALEMPPANSDDSALEMPPANGDEVTGVFTGLVTNDSTGEPVAEGQRVLLYVVNEAFEENVLETTTGTGGRYRFDEVPVRRGWHYLVSVQYGDGFFTGGMVAGTPDNPDADVPVSVYDVTNDPAVIVIEDVLTQVIPVEGGFQFVQIFRFSNTSDRLFLTDEIIDESRNASVRVTLPEGAQITAFEDQRRYALAEDGRTVINTQPVFPGDRHIMHVSYMLPENSSLQIEQPLSYRLAGPVQIIAPEVLRIDAPQLTTGSSEEIEGNTFRTYSGSLNLDAGAALQYTVSLATSDALDTNTLIAAVLAGVGTLALLSAFFLYWRSQRGTDQQPAAATAGAAPPVDLQARIDDLVTQIADLDREQRAGNISAAAYQERRGQLKARLAALMKEKE